MPANAPAADPPSAAAVNRWFGTSDFAYELKTRKNPL
jgi:hypothetical protein